MSATRPLWMPTQGDVDFAVESARALVRQAQAEYSPKATICLFSGGNDSVVLFHLVRDLIDNVAHIDTGTGIPETRVFVEETVRAFGVPLLIEETSPNVYEDMVLKRGFPGPGMHFMYYTRLKERRLDDIKRRIVGRRGKDKLLLLTGLRLSESARRKMHIGRSGPIHPASHSPRMIFCNPIMDFSADLLAAYKDQHALPRNPVADLLHMSGECLCGAYAHPGERKEIAYWFPEVGRRITALEDRVEAAGLEHCRWGHGGEGGAVPLRPVGELCQSCELFPVADDL